jgi:3-dehydroquinate dehydratase/shikimate dehydrogenase
LSDSDPPPSPAAELVATCTRPPEGEELASLAGRANWLEVRSDLAGDLEPAALRGRFGGGLLYTVRSRAEGGRGENDPAARRERLLAAAAAGWDLVDLEGERDLDPGLLDRLPAERRLISWHGPGEALPELQRRFAAMASTPARLYKMVPTASLPGQALPPLQLLAALGRRDLIAFAGGSQGSWTRTVAPRLGAPWIYGAAGDRPGAPGQPTVARLVRDYGLPALPPAAGLCGVVGHPVGHSLSPRLHNGAYRELGLPLAYVAFEPERFADFWIDVVESGAFEGLGMPLVGLSVTAPFKRAALAVAGAASPRAEAVGAANTLVARDGVWEAECTDPEGVVLPLLRRGVPLDGMPAAVIGAGGAGRAAAFALDRAGSRVILVNRSEEGGRHAAASLGVGFEPLAGFDPGRFRLIVNATPAVPFDPERLAPGTAVVEMGYRRTEGAPASTPHAEAPPVGSGAESAQGRGSQPGSPLLAAARAGGGVAIDGREVLLYQALGQFRLMTGRELPEGLGRRLLGLEHLE